MKKKVLLVLLGIFFSLILLEAGMRLAGFTYLYLQEQGNMRSLKKKGAYKILCLGESTTQGQYPRYLEEELNNRIQGMKFSVIDRGCCAINTNVILASLENDLDRYKPDMLITMMGVNDGKSGVVVYEYEQQVSYYKKLKLYKLMGLLQMHLDSRIRTIKTVTAENNFKKALISGPKDIQASFGLANSYANTGRYEDAEKLYKEAVGLNPKNEQGYIKLGDFYLSMGKLKEAEKQYRKVIEMNPDSSQGYIKLGDWYSEQRRYKESDDPYKKAIEKLNPTDELGYLHLGNSYKQRGRNKTASAIYRKVIEINPKNEQAYLSLGDSYLGQERYKETEESYEKVIELNPKNEQVYLSLVNYYSKQGKFKEAEKQYLKAVKINPKQKKSFYFVPDMFWILPDNGIEKYVRLKERRKDDKNDIETETKTEDKDIKINSKIIEDNEEQTDHLSAGTVYNYKKLRNVLKERNITYVCVQYPVRKVSELKGIFQENKDIIFVDNEKSFKDGVEKEGYNAYFKDNFGEEGWGHCTPKGNKLLARNIADTLIKEVFNKQ